MKDQEQIVDEKLLVTEWIRGLSENGVVEEMSPEILKSVLSEFGANFEPKPELKALSSYSNLKKDQALTQFGGPIGQININSGSKII